MNTDNLRIILKFVDNQWIKVNFMDLKKGDNFRMFEPDTMKPVIHDDLDIFIAMSDPYVNKDGINQIEV